VKRSFFCGLILGALLASGGFLAHQRFAKRPRLPNTKGTSDYAEDWLLEADFSVSRLYAEPMAQSILEAPESISIHRSGADGISLLGYSFATHGVTPSEEDARIPLKTFRAPNAYTGISACEFNPGVLVRLKRNQHKLDLLVCFSCEDVLGVLDEEKSVSLGAGLSDVGVGALRSVFRRAFPNDSAFKKP
jgi:hypothetical protein